MRFGQRLRIEKEIDDSLLDTMVPQLILQPIIENAVVHGVEVIKSGVIRLKIFRENNNVVLSVINSGKNMTQEDIERVQNILSSKTPVKEVGDGTHTSLGIRNVNERIKLIYGEEYGLTILPTCEGETASTITIASEPMDSPKNGKLHKLFMEKID
jgi:two-component system sensor histidine kinase YesM